MRNPVITVLGTAVIFAVGGAGPVAALADEPTPTPAPGDGTADPTPAPDPTTPAPEPTPTPTTPAPTPSTPAPVPSKPVAPVLQPALTISTGSVAPGRSLTAKVTVRATKATARGAQVRLSASGAKVKVSPARRSLGEVTSKGESVIVTVTVPEGTAPATVTLLATVTADGAADKTVSRTFAVTAADAAPVAPVAPGAVLPPPGASALPTDLLLPPPGVAAPQIAAPPVAPLIAPALYQTPQRPVPITLLRDSDAVVAAEQRIDGLTALQAGWLAALVTGDALLLVWLRAARRRSARHAAPAGLETLPAAPVEGKHRRARRGVYSERFPVTGAGTRRPKPIKPYRSVRGVYSERFPVAGMA